MKRPFLAAVLALVLFSACGGGAVRISSVEPKEVKSGLPVMIDIKGSGFKPGAVIKIGGSPSPQVVVTGSKQIVALLPRDLPAGAVAVAVENPGGAKAELASAIKVLTGITITSVEPPSMTLGETISVHITGAGFAVGTKVFFNDLPAEAEVKNDRSVVAKVPALPAGLATIRLEAPDGGKSELSSGFQVLGPGDVIGLRKMRDETDALELSGSNMKNRTGVGVADFNNDGKLDLAVTSPYECRILLAGPDKFLDIGASGITPPNITYGAFPADFDNDGLPDLMLTGQPGKLYHNLGDAKFEEVTARVGLPVMLSWSAAWTDFDGDGLLDLYLGAPGGEDVLLRNTGGKFVEVFKGHWQKMENAAKTNNRQPSTFSAVFGDINNDGWSELFAGIRGQESRFYRNQSGKDFVFANSEVGFKFDNNGIYQINWGLSWADYDNDGLLDLFAASGPLGANLYRNTGGKTFTDVSSGMGIRFTESPLCPAWGDLDNDGWLDLAVADNKRGIMVYRNLGDGSFAEANEDLDISQKSPLSAPMSLTWIDFNRDGALDLFTTGFTQANRMFVNSPYPGRHWLQVKLDGAKSNRSGIGAIVVLEVGGRKLTQQVAGGSGYLMSPPSILHFGLDQATTVDKLTVIWPGGSTQTMEQIPADQLLTVTQPGERKKVSLPPAGSVAPAPTPVSPAPAAPNQSPLPNGMITPRPAAPPPK